MPELPEVQTTVDDINKHVKGYVIKGYWTDWPKYTRPISLMEFTKAVKGKKIIKARRRAKYIVIELSGGRTMLVHQKMSGHLLYGYWEKSGNGWKGVYPKEIKDDPYNRHIRAIFFLDKMPARRKFPAGSLGGLALSDLRRFARIHLVDTKNVEQAPEIKGLGPEPLDHFTLKKFKECLKGKKGKIKVVLMNPKIIAGIGNIYSDEILWFAGVHPLRSVASLTEPELKKIYTAIQNVLKKAIKAKGSSNSDYRQISGEKGKFQTMQKAYRQTGKPCAKKDGEKIHRIKIGGRSAHFCPKHQK